MKVRQLAESIFPWFGKAPSSRPRKGIGVQSPATLRTRRRPADSQAIRNALLNLAVLSKTPSSSLLASIRASYPDSPLIIVGIDGPSGLSRKRLCAELRKRADDVTVISASDFRQPVDRSLLKAVSSRELFEDCFDWERLRREVLEPLSNNRPAVYRDASGERLRVAPKGVVLFEGVYTLRPELYPFYDYTVFVKSCGAGASPADAASKVEDWYQDAYHPAAMADTLLEGDWF